MILDHIKALDSVRIVGDMRRQAMGSLMIVDRTKDIASLQIVDQIKYTDHSQV